ncbi:hypothetical protein [Kribbella qitaiheensis]|nr:hypothetical protein [Kribbella qitaiheensis]
MTAEEIVPSTPKGPRPLGDLERTVMEQLWSADGGPDRPRGA